MLKWLVVFALVCIVFSAVLPRLARSGIGRIPGDIRFRVRGTEVSIPLGSTALSSTIRRRQFTRLTRRVPHRRGPRWARAGTPRSLRPPKLPSALG